MLFKKPQITSIALFVLFITQLSANRFINEQKLWKHVVTVDRLAWQERDGLKKINKQVDDESFVRRIYLDITGKIPTYDQMLEFRQSKAVNKRQLLIEELLDSTGYVSHFSTFWFDLLRNPYSDPEGFSHKEFTRYVERFLFENKKYNEIVYDFFTAKGMAQHNPSVGFFLRDRGTNSMDTTNASVRAFLGTRIGCAQCHNHRFDKWTQKEFYETAAYFHGVGYRDSFPRRDDAFNFHKARLKSDSRYTKELFSAYSSFILNPTRANISFDENAKLKYPFNYVYDNAKPNSAVKERIVFGYGDKKVEGKTKREVFANWVTSKNNPMFARIMANRLWKRIMEVAIMDPIDDWKDNIQVQNPHLFEALGKIFSELDYDMKAFLSVVFNSEAYQYAIDTKNKFKQDNYKVQGAILKRMSAQQLSDSLLTLRHGDLDANSKIRSEYFEFEDQVNELAAEFIKGINPLLNAYRKKYGRDAQKYEELDPKILDYIFVTLEKLKEIKDYHNIGDNGYIKNSSIPIALSKKKTQVQEGMTLSSTMAQKGGSMKQDASNIKAINRAHTKNSDFMSVFGSLDRSAPETNLETGATMKQILKMMNSQDCIAVTRKDSQLMKNTMKREKLTSRVSYLYYSIYGRAPKSKDLRIAEAYFSKGNTSERWSKYVLALLNSPEFYFIK
jgi:hypothetical protein